MTRSREKGENEITRLARHESIKTGIPVEAILARMLATARRAKDTATQAKIVQAQKFLRARNRGKRRGRQ